MYCLFACFVKQAHFAMNRYGGCTRVCTKGGKNGVEGGAQIGAFRAPKCGGKGGVVVKACQWGRGPQE